MAVAPRVQRYLDRAGQRVIGEAGKLWLRHHGAYERLAELTSIAASPTEPTYLFSTKDRVISPAVYGHGDYEEDGLRWILDYLGQPQRGRTVVEVGANIGTTTIPLLVRYGAARVEAFEPDPSNYDLLRCNLILNHVDDRATTHRAAVSDANDSVVFELCHANFGDHRVRVTEVGVAGLHDEANRSTITVPSRRLDDAVTTAGDEIGLVWVDAQGHEAHIVDGAGQLLSRGIPWVIEYWPYGLSRQDGLTRLNHSLAQRFTDVVDVRQSQRQGKVVRVETAGLDQLAAQMGADYTDFILEPKAATRRQRA